ncbi:MAG: glycosyltransferase family 4 protein [Pseudomonadota bacterium]
MRVLHFYRTAFPESMGGTEQFIHQLATKTSELGVRNEVLCLTKDRSTNSIKVGDYMVHRAKLDFEVASTGFSVSVINRFAQLAKHADIINNHFPWPFMDIVHFTARIKTPVVVTYHSDIIRQRHLLKLYRPLQRLFLNSVDHIIATSENYLQSSDILNRYKEKVSVIPIGIDSSTYAEPSYERRQFWQKQFGENFFLFVGVIRYYKGLHILLEAARTTGYPVVIIGAGPIERELKTQKIKMGINNVHFLGYVNDEDKIALLSLSRALVFPSHLRSEAFGISLLEGAMYGKPLISCEIGTGTSFINIAGETGLVVPPSDAKALAQAMTFLWQQPQLAEEMGRRAYQRYSELFTAERMANSYIDLYSRILDGKQKESVS